MTRTRTYTPDFATRWVAERTGWPYLSITDRDASLPVDALNLIMGHGHNIRSSDGSGRDAKRGLPTCAAEQESMRVALLTAAHRGWLSITPSWMASVTAAGIAHLYHRYEAQVRRDGYEVPAS